MKCKGDCHTSCCYSTGSNTKVPRNQRQNWDYPDNNTSKINENTEENPGVQKRLVAKTISYWPVWKPGKKNNAKNAHNSIMVKNYCLCKLVQSSLNIQILWSCACLVILIKDNGIKVRRIIWNLKKKMYGFLLWRNKMYDTTNNIKFKNIIIN